MTCVICNAKITENTKMVKQEVTHPFTGETKELTFHICPDGGLGCIKAVQ